MKVIINKYKIRLAEESSRLGYDCKNLDGVFHFLELTENKDERHRFISISQFYQKTYFDCDDWTSFFLFHPCFIQLNRWRDLKDLRKLQNKRKMVFCTESKAGKASTLSSTSAGSSSLIFGLLRPPRFSLHFDLDSQAKSKVNRENSQRNRVK